jgi:tRNA(fMet)-specific endonuclease VapC
MSGKFIVDTNVWARILRGDTVLGKILRDAGDIYICTHVAGELLYGAFKSTQVQKNLDDIHEILDTTTFLRADETTALKYGELKQFLAKQGTLLPENDMWIAATALQYGLTLVTDDAHFDAIPHLAKQRW